MNGLSYIYETYVNNNKRIISDYTNIIDSLKAEQVALMNNINKINNTKFSVYKEFDNEIDNIEYLMARGVDVSLQNAIVSILRGTYRKHKELDNKIDKVRLNIKHHNRLILTEQEFKFILVNANFHYSNVILLGYKDFEFGNNLGKLKVIRYNNEKAKRGVDWGLSNQYKAKLIKEGKIPYNKKTAPNGIKWIITFNHKPYDLFLRWVGRNSYFSTETHVYKPSLYRPSYLLNEDGSVMTTNQLKAISTISDIPTLPIGMVQKLHFYDELDEHFNERFMDKDFNITDYKITYKTIK